VKLSTYHYHFRKVYYEDDKKITTEWDVPSDDANPEPIEKAALEIWAKEALCELEVTGPYYFSMDRWRFYIHKEAIQSRTVQLT
jgi:hypothetical protein